jgi:putative ATPase
VSTATPLAEALRPAQLDQVLGQSHLLGPMGPLYKAIGSGRLPSMILWGPPGVGKTTIARLLVQSIGARMLMISAVLSGVKEIRDAVAQAELYRSQGALTVVFVDEVHRFNKTQQDAFLPHVESGLFVFIGATTENPAFEVNRALLSRAQVFRLASLDEAALRALLDRALQVDGLVGLGFEEDAKDRLLATADGDGRRLLNLVELVGLAFPQRPAMVSDQDLSSCLPGLMRQFDKGGDSFYDQISALHKSVRGSDPDAALYWLARMLDGGADPHYVARRLIRMASEDIGLADPRALEMTLSAAQAYERLGSPEGELALAQATVFLAMAAKSNAVYVGWKAARAVVDKTGSLPVPDHLRNAPTALAKSMGHGRDYRYSHDEPDAFSAGQTYLPDSLLAQPALYQPVDRGLESKIAEKLAILRQKNLEKKTK